MADAATSDTKSQSWRPLLWGMAAFLLLPMVPLGDVIFPVQQTLLLFVPALAVCSIIGWKSGSRAALAVIWLGLAVWMLLQPAGEPGTAYSQMARAWAIVLAASFGLVSLLSSATPFFVRALASVGVALAVALTIALSSPSGIARFQHAGGEELMRRSAATLNQFQQKWDTEQWKDLTAKAPPAAVSRRLGGGDRAGAAKAHDPAHSSLAGAGIAGGARPGVGRVPPAVCRENRTGARAID